MRVVRDPRRRRGRALAPLLAFATAAQLSAQEPRDRLYDSFDITVSAAVLIFDSDVRIDSERGDLGTEIDAERDLDLAPVKLLPRVALRWRPARRHELEIGFQLARRRSRTVLDRHLEVRDTSFSVGADLRSTLDSDNAFLTYRMALIARERTQFGIGLGFGAIFQEARLEGTATVSSGGGSSTAEYGVSEDVLAPTGSIGLYARIGLGHRWVIEPDLRGLVADLDRFDVRVLEAGLAIRYFLRGGLGTEIAWGGQGIRVDVEPDVERDVVRQVGGRLGYRTQNVRVGIVLVP